MTLPSPLHKKWVNRLETEFFLQGDKERGLGVSVSPLMDRKRPALSVSQKAFFKAVTIPLFKRLTDLLPKTQTLLVGCQRNMDAL
jgi:hypothetical protein